MKIFILIFAFMFLFQSCKEGSSIQQENSTSQSDYEIKKRELELKEKELDLKEKEMKFNAKQNRIQQEEAKIFIESWAAIQSNKAIDSYISLYSPDFQGIKKTKSGKTTYFNYSEWINDRSKMYTSAKNLSVSAYEIKLITFNETTGKTKIQFTQYYSSENYQDEGMKVMDLIRDDSGNIKIIREEMVYSGEVMEGC